MKSVAAMESAVSIIESGLTVASGNFTPAQMAQVVLPALANDKIRARRELAGATAVRREAAILAGCAVLGHVGAPVRLSDGALLYQRPAAAPRWNLARAKRLQSRDMGDGLVTSLPRTGQYYHFLETLLPLIDYLDRRHPPGAPLTVLVGDRLPPFQRSVFGAIQAAFPQVEFMPLGRGERAEVGRYLWLHEAAENAEWLPVTAGRAARFGAILRAAYGQPAPMGGELMLFSRGNARLRRLLNEPDLQAIAERRGFRRFEAASGNHPEQVARFGNADVIVAVHGAGLANLLFARPRTVVVELFPQDFVKSTYLWLCNRLGLRHVAVIGCPGTYDQDFRVPPALFSAALEEALSAAGNASRAA
jgi:hypothetical protein